MKVNFYLKDKTKSVTAIDAIVRFLGARYKFAAGVSVNPVFWDGERAMPQKGKLKYADADVINIKLDRMEAAIKKAFEPYILATTAPTQGQIRAQTEKPGTLPQSGAFVPYFSRFVENATYKHESKKKFYTCLNWLNDYEREFNTRLTFDDINLEFYNHFRQLMMNKTYLPRAGGLPKHYTSNFFGSLVKVIKRVMHEAEFHRLHTNIDFKSNRFKVEAETADTVYLNMDELRKIHALNLDTMSLDAITTENRPGNIAKKRGALKLARAKFLVGCFTALRVGDFNRLREVNITENVIRIKPGKGTRKNEDVVIPIHPVVKEILATGFSIETPVSDQKINEHIKEVCQLAGITELVSVSRTEGGKLVTRTYPKHQLITNHTARRSGATNMFLAGIPSISIMKITNHTTEKSFLKYIKISQEENAELLKKHPFFNA